MTIEAKIEAILFYKAEPVEITALARLVGEDIADVKNALARLDEMLSGHGIALVRTEESAFLGTSKEASELIEEIARQELQKDLGKAALETLTVILYKGPVSKSEIDYIRGVNASYILRNLLIRGLIERKPHSIDKRSFVYMPSVDLLSYLGVGSVEELPEYKEMKEKINEFEESFKEHEEEKDSDGALGESEEEEGDDTE